jgi:hypothetical protein
VFGIGSVRICPSSPVLLQRKILNGLRISITLRQRWRKIYLFGVLGIPENFSIQIFWFLMDKRKPANPSNESNERKKPKTGALLIHEVLPHELWMQIFELICINRKDLRNFMLVCKDWQRLALENLKLLPLHGPISEKAFKSICNFSNLRSIKLGECKYSSTFRGLTKLKRLNHISFILRKATGKRYTHQSISEIFGSCLQLNTIVISGAKNSQSVIDSNNWSKMLSLPSLSCLETFDLSLDVSSIPTNLQRLCFWRGMLTSPKMLTTLTTLTSLELLNTENYISISILQPLTLLRELLLDQRVPSLIYCGSLIHLTNLHKLVIRAISLSSFAFLSALTKLETLELQVFENIGDISPLQHLVSLKSFILGIPSSAFHFPQSSCLVELSRVMLVSKPSPETVQGLAKLPKLKVAGISNGDEETIVLLSASTTINMILMNNCTTNARVTECLKKMTQMVAIHFQGCSGINRQALIHLSEIPQLKVLSLIEGGGAFNGW